MRILGIETSCDETAAAVVEDGRKLLSNVVASSLDLHAAYGGVVPEIAARSHIESIVPVIEEALKLAKTDWRDIDAIAVTKGPGLIGSLLIGVLTARTLALVKDKPLYGVNHVLAHPYAAFITDTALLDYSLAPEPPTLPLLALIISGGHSSLVLIKDHANYQVLGQTADDAVGEAYDKVAKLLGLPYPGGPSVDKKAEIGDSTSVELPVARMDGYDFSFSGLKTAVLRSAQAAAGKDYAFPSSKLPEALDDAQKANLAASFQATAIKSLLGPLVRAVEAYQPRSVVIAGGVAASQELRRQANQALKSVVYPDLKLCTDNAAMVAALAYYHAGSTKPSDPCSLGVFPALAL